MSKQYAHLSTRYGQNICEVSKRLAKNCRRSCAHKSIVDERITARLYRTCVLTQVRQKCHEVKRESRLIFFLVLNKNILHNETTPIQIY